MNNNKETVSIKIPPNVYGAFRQLPNKVWFALAEFVDNSIQSYIDNKDHLRRINKNFVLEVTIMVNKEEDTIYIGDNAAGIGVNNYWRAFEPANIPTDNTGLNEYGMGMKTAAIWLADEWKVVTKAIGETQEKTTVFNLDKVINEQKEVLIVENKSKPKNEHYTYLFLKGLSVNAPKSQQNNKIKSHLTSIYRKFIRSGELKLYFNEDKPLKYEPPSILKAPFWKDTEGPSVLWKKEINLKLGKYSAKGFVGLLEIMSTSEKNGISLFRRGRVIEGSHNDKYRPKALCGDVGSPQYKRVFGELELEGFGVSFNKGSFVETDFLEALMDAIKMELTHKDFNLLNQGQKYTKPKTKVEAKKSAEQIFKKLREKNNQPKNPIKIPNKERLKTKSSFEKKKIIKESQGYEQETIHQTTYGYKIKLVNEPSHPLYSCVEGDSDNHYDITINLAHEVFTNTDLNHTVVSIIKALALAEQEATNMGTREAGNLRLMFNELVGRV